MSDESNNRRVYSPRVPIELKVEYDRKNSFFADYTKNISQGGTFIGTAKPMPIGTEFVFKLHVAGVAEPLSIRGEVMWVVQEDDLPKEGEEKSDPGMGIRFVYASASERETIESAVRDLMIESLGEDVAAKLMSKSDWKRS